jgi:hypothetical protein
LNGYLWAKLVSAETVNKVSNTLAAAYKFATKKLKVKHNPMAEVEQIATQVTADDMEADAAGAIPDQRRSSRRESQRAQGDQSG